MPVTVAALRIAPVKALAVVSVPRVRIERPGVPGDRAFFLLDEAGSVVTLRAAPELAAVAPAWTPEEERLALRLPDGEVVQGRVRLGAAVASELFGKVRAGRVVEGPFGPALSRVAGRELRLVRAQEPGTGWDEAPVSIVGDGSLAEVARRGGRDAVDPRRFRMLVELAGLAPHEEDGWVGSEATLGGARLRVVAALERCAVITRHPETGERDWDGLRVLARYRGKDHVELGILAEVLEPGEVAVGDELVVAGRVAA
jgi:uncharacterized protein YcbX